MNMKRNGSPFKGLKRSTGLKLVIICVLVLIFLIPLGMVQSLIRERENRQAETENDILSSWGGPLTYAGPILVVDYIVKETYYDAEKEKSVIRDAARTLYILPESLNLSVKTKEEVRHRGIFSVPLFSGDFAVYGSFSWDELSSQLGSDNPRIQEIRLVNVLSETRGISSMSDLTWLGKTYSFEPGPGRTGLYDGEVETIVPLTAEDEKADFSFNFSINGGKTLSFIPLGKDTAVSLQSGWISPSFFGQYLPVKRDINDDGFIAEWKTSYLSRNYPTYIKDIYILSSRIQQSSFGVKMIAVVSHYDKNTRSVKYGILFLIIPFMTFFLFEILLKVRIHPIQYFLVGSANIVFYLLLVSLSEHISFNLAYLAAALAVTILLSFYSGSAVKNRKKGFLITPILGLSYLFLFTVLQSEDYALLYGSIGLFILIGAVMFFTRRVAWYNGQDSIDSNE